MGRNVIFYLSDDERRLLEACEALGLITNRSKWLRDMLIAFALEKNLDIAFEQSIEQTKDRLSKLEALKEQTIKVASDRERVWEKIVLQFLARRGTRQADVNWLKSRRREIRFCRPSKTFSEVLGELAALRREGGGT